MALKFEIIGNSLVVTETADGTVKLERPASDVFGVCELNQFKIFTRTQRVDILLSADYSSLVDSTGAALTKSTLTTFFRNKLGFNKAGSSALTTIQGTFGVGQTLTAVVADGVIATGFQWYRANADGSNLTAIAGATKNTYLQQDIDQGKVITVRLTGFIVSATNADAIPSLSSARPAFMQASPIGASGSFRLVTGHNSVCMFRAAADVDGVELTISNAILYESGTASEAYPPDGYDLQVNCEFFTPTWPYVETTRNFNAPLAAGATTGTLTGNAPGSTLEYCRFSNGDWRWIRLTGGSPNVTWDQPLSSAAASNPKTLQTSRRGSFTLDGNPNVVLKGGQFSIIQPIMTGLNIKRNDPVYVEFYVSRVGGGSFLLPGNMPANWQDDLANGLLEAYNDSVTNSSQTRFGSPPWYSIAGGATMFRPMALRGFNLQNNIYRPVTIYTDSIGNFSKSWVQRLMHRLGVPYVNYGKAGQTISQLTDPANPISPYIADKGAAIIQIGRNMWNLPALQQAWAMARARGHTKIIQVLPPPITNTTDNGATEANQTQDTTTSALFAEIYALVGTENGPHAVWPVYDAVKGVDPFKWAAGYSSESGQLVHPNDTGSLAIVNFAIANNWANDLAL